MYIELAPIPKQVQVKAEWSNNDAFLLVTLPEYGGHLLKISKKDIVCASSLSKCVRDKVLSFLLKQ